MQKVPVKSSPPTNRRAVILQAGCVSCRPTNTEGKQARNGKLKKLKFGAFEVFKVVLKTCKPRFKNCFTAFLYNLLFAVSLT